VRIRDDVTNIGYRPTRHGLLYHVNLGYPLLDEMTRIEGVDDGYAQRFRSEPPLAYPDCTERVDAVLVKDCEGKAAVRVSNPALGGLALVLGFDLKALPAFTVWRAYQSGIFALGIEPHTGLGDPAARRVPADLDFLAPGDKRSYALSLEAELHT
jgi:hypothetical protein